MMAIWDESPVPGWSGRHGPGGRPRTVHALETVLFPAYIAKSAEAGAEMNRRQQGIDIITAHYDELQDQLEAQRRREWTDYGAALKAHIEAAAAAIPGLAVPVEVRIDIETYRRGPRSDEEWGLEAQLVDQARAATATPDGLPGSPLERLEQS